MRAFGLLLAVLVSGIVSAAQAPPPQQPVFRTGVDLLSVDATVLDRDGRQITDLSPKEFVVEVDGRARPVVSAEYIRLVDPTALSVGARPAAETASPDDAFFSSNARTGSTGRLILLLVDEGNIRSGQGREVMRAATRFVDGLAPSDRVAMAAVPRGALVDFTTDHERVREALLATIGRATPYKGRFYMSLSEAFAAYEHSDAVLRNQLVMRECAAMLGNPVELTRCEIEVEHEAGEYVNHERQQTQASMTGIRQVLRSLGALDGPKHVILISEGLVLEGLGGDVDHLAAEAADVRASLDVMLLEVPAVDASIAQRPSTPREDRERQITGLEMLAGISRGALHRVVSTSDSAFTRIMRSIAGHYLLAVEAAPTDRDGRRHRISVKTTRRGLTVYSRRGFLGAAPAGARTAAETVTRALRSPLSRSDVAMRLATWTYKEPGGSKVRLLINAEVQRSADQPLEYTAGMVLVDRADRAIASNVETRPLRTLDTHPGVALYTGSLLVDPGTYRLRFAVVDSEGRLGSVERIVQAWAMDVTALTIGDLVIGPVPVGGVPIAPAIEPVVHQGQLAALMEVYHPSLAPATLEATIEILPGEGEKPLLTMPMQVGAGASPEVGVLQGIVSTAPLPPGRYLARATVRQEGKAQGHLVRPFRVVVPARAVNDTAGAVPVLPPNVLAALVGNLPAVDARELVTPAVLTTVLGEAEKSRPDAKAAFAAARAGKLGPAALEALGAGDQAVAAFLRGVDLFVQGQTDRALQQLQVSMQQAPTFAPTRLYLGAVLSHSRRHREAAALLQSVGSEFTGAAPVARLTALSWLRAGDAPNAIAALEKARATGDASVARTLALAYVAADRARDAVPLLVQHLQAEPRDPEALLAGLYATYAQHVPTPQADTLDADRTRAEAWARTYAAIKGEQLALVDVWMAYLRGAK